eukprot:augustus_masked-scaffold_10-processed-gene-3.4-mRNA-1 protein AED:1.00 eAED:1.00 QI:0/0/0/0/1/1/3/0/491
MAPPTKQKKDKDPTQEAKKSDEKSETAVQDAVTPDTDKPEEEAFMETHSDKEESFTVEEVKTFLEQERIKDISLTPELHSSNALALEQEVRNQLVNVFSPTGAATESIKTQLQSVLTSDVFMGTVESRMKNIAITVYQEHVTKKNNIGDETSLTLPEVTANKTKKPKTHKEKAKSKKTTHEVGSILHSDQSHSTVETPSHSDTGTLSIYDFEAKRKRNQNTNLLIKKVYDTLRAKGAKVQATKEVEAYLENRRSKFKVRNKKNVIKRMKDNLRWPKNVIGGDEQVDNFFDDVDMFLSDLTPKKKKLHFKKIIKIMVNALPASFEISADEVSYNKQLWSMKEFKELLYSRSFVADKHKPKVRATKLTRIEKPTTSKPKRQDSSFEAVNGIADTGSDRNISPLSIIPKYAKSVEDPQYVFEIEFPDKTRYQVKKVVLADAMLVQDDLQLSMNKQRFFCVDHRNWTKILIGLNTLNKFGLRLDLKNAPEAKPRA